MDIFVYLITNQKFNKYLPLESWELVVSGRGSVKLQIPESGFFVWFRKVCKIYKHSYNTFNANFYANQSISLNRQHFLSIFHNFCNLKLFLATCDHFHTSPFHTLMPNEIKFCRQKKLTLLPAEIMLKALTCILFVLSKFTKWTKSIT